MIMPLIKTTATLLPLLRLFQSKSLLETWNLKLGETICALVEVVRNLSNAMGSRMTDGGFRMSDVGFWMTVDRKD